MNEPSDLLEQEKAAINTRRRRINLLIAIIFFTIFIVVIAWVFSLPTFDTIDWVQWDNPLQCRRGLIAYISIGIFLSCAVIERIIRVDKNMINPLSIFFIFGILVSGTLLICN